MNFIERIIYWYECIFYKEYTCFNCGIDFRMKKVENDEEMIPACSYGCLMGGVAGQFQSKHGKNWKVEFTRYIKSPTKYEEDLKNL